MIKGRQSNKGVKRKRSEFPKEKDLNAKLVGKLHHDLKEVRKAAKRAKTFEMQKLVKKLKGLRLKNTSEHDITEFLPSNLQHLIQEISHEAVANTALKSKLSKDRELSTNEPIQAALSQELNSNFLRPADGTTSAAKVQSRLLSSKILAAEVASALEDLRLVLHPSKTAPADEGAEADALDPRPRKMKKLMHQNGEGDVAMEGVEGDPPDLADMDDEPEDDNSGWESGTIGDDEKELDDDWESHSLATDDDGEHMDDDPPETGGTSRSTKPKVNSTESTFLPTLSTGFIRGDTSDWSEGEERAADLAKKKNRRGQRARRAIWEKKYGSNANHKKHEMADTNDRGRNRRSQNTKGGNRGGIGGVYKATGSSGMKPGHRNQRGTDLSAAPERSNGTTQSQVDQKSLHPSWEAKKRLKEKMNAVTPPPPGRKIVFS
ncbi:hypothetical protein AAF712_003026 [Marasmius tenuissimus]|uniref:Bud22 domain-containing protein n=1 Tax=Marasmius tenuissimus TaxID=585030 RepID=A0ABR3A8P5_9AGAR